jgi:hypothetical protein
MHQTNHAKILVAFESCLFFYFRLSGWLILKMQPVLMEIKRLPNSYLLKIILVFGFVIFSLMFL